ncbi:MAG: GH116 family glycosyl hydrolase [Verrucomicrobiota bacterium]|nr:GH116 family glycosyl hydrolase [Verrucomicrobiota bacterium]
MRKCACSGRCTPAPEGYSRREFIELMGATAAGALLAPGARADFSMPEQEFNRWKASLFEGGQPRVYTSEKHTDARLHLGGIGTGNLEIGADGQFTTWQLFNTLRDGHVPLYFAVKAGKVARLLQTAGGPNWPRIARIEMTGEYPVAKLRFIDDALPVKVELTAFTPFVPLDSRVSSMPLAALVFKLTNTTAEPMTVSLAAFMQNPVGYDARGTMEDNRYPGCGWNVNEPFSEAAFSGLLFRAEHGEPASIDRPVDILASANLKELEGPPTDRPSELRVTCFGAEASEFKKIADPARTVIWFEDAPENTPEPILRAAQEAVNGGAVLVFGGADQPLLRAYAAFTGGKPIARVDSRPDILFEDFEQGYRDWKVEGAAFGSSPAGGTLPNQQRVTGFHGKGLVNTYLGGDDTEGRLTSRAFKIERNYIRFLVGGGSHATTQIRLVVDGRVVRAASGKNNEKLEPAIWDVREFAGRDACIQIVDEQKGPWGHINVDQIVFSDDPANRATFQLLEELLPIRFSGIRTEVTDTKDAPQVEFVDMTFQRDSTEQTGSDRRKVFVRSLGKGKVIVVQGRVLVPAHAGLLAPRQRAYEFLCSLLGVRFVRMQGQHQLSMGFGTVGLGVLTGQRSETSAGNAGDTPRVTALVSFGSWDGAWDRFSSDGAFDPMANAMPSSPSSEGQTSRGAMAASVLVRAGETVQVPFVLTWHFPNKYNDAGKRMGCRYTTGWQDARAVMRSAAASWPALRDKTERFQRLFHGGTLPWWLLDCISANAATIRHVGVVFQIENGDVYGWEGSNGCCQPTCTHVWGYEQSLAHLFPDLEREMRRIDFKHQQREDGGINNRTEVPSPPRPTGEQPFADGHASCVLKAYREALNSTDEQFFEEYWPRVRNAVEYLVQRDASSHNGRPAGYLEDDQWNTYDEALHGVTTFISGYYLAALLAGETWARRIGDTAAADRWHEIFERGQKNLIDLCWNGEYFQQHLPGYEKMPGEVGPGCMSDQLIGQWWAHQLGLGYVLPKEKVVSALRFVFRYNFKTDLTEWRHAPRAFAGARDKGLIICTWPRGGRPPHVMLYSDEVWTGIEYQVAAHMIYEGLVEEGLAIVKAARERYDGIPRPPITRNPWNEIECGGHYARAMSSWSLLAALSGWHYDGPRCHLTIEPRYKPDSFASFWCGTEGWGVLTQQRNGQSQRNDVSVAEGRLRLRRFALPVNRPFQQARVELGGSECRAQIEISGGWVRINFQTPVTIEIGRKLAVSIQ